MKIYEAEKHGAKKAILQILESSGLEKFTTVQQKAIEGGLCNGKSLVIAAPTSSGKTTIAEIAAVNGALEGKKTVYLVTHKALAEEKFGYFKNTYDSESEKWFGVSIATGDRSEGDWNDGILVATYEKYLALISSSNSYSITNRVVVADEIQIIDDSSRGADVEILLSIIRRQKPSQIIALSATAPNVDEIAGWLTCAHIIVSHRDVPLRQEVWSDKKRHYNYLGTEDFFEENGGDLYSEDTLQVVQNLLREGLGPILVFTMTKREATEMAQKFSLSRQQDAKSYKFAKQLELFAEPTGTTETLKGTTERKVAFHSADLSFAERSVVEKALRDRELDVVFSTPTLAAGVNFPIRTVLFNSFSRFWVPGEPWISKSEYLNMSGRAGRLGLDEEGLSILIPHSKAEAYKAKEYLSPNISPLQSKLLNKSIRKSILSLIASKLCKSEIDLNHFYSETFWWHQHLEHNPKILEQIPTLVSKSIEWLCENRLISGGNQKLVPTPLGKAISSTGLLPSTGVALLEIIINNEHSFTDDKFELPLIHAICSSDEFSEENGQRFLPFARNNSPEHTAWTMLQSVPLFHSPDSVDNYDKVTNATYGVYRWSKGVSERQLRNEMPPISYGQLHVLSSDVAWIVEGMSKILSTPGVCPNNTLSTKLHILSEKIRYGVVDEAIDIMKASQLHDVPGLGRQRAMALVAKGIYEPNTIVNTTLEKLKDILESEDRARFLLEAISKLFSKKISYWKNLHIRKAKELGCDTKLIEASYEKVGTEYEDPISCIAKEFGWGVEKLDSGKRQGVPDLMLTCNNSSILLECKTKDKDDATIKKEDAFAVLTKGVDINADHFATIGKPDFCSFSKSKAGGSNKITLIPHFAFVEAYLLWKKGEVSSDQVFKWLLTPGLASVESIRNISNFSK